MHGTHEAVRSTALYGGKAMSAGAADGGWAAWINEHRQDLLGSLFVLGPAQFLLVLLVGAAVVPDYSIHGNAISDLGVAPATALLFNVSVFLAGAANAAAGWLAYRDHGHRWLLAVFVLAGLGSMGVGLFPENTGAPHLVAALVSFVFLNLEAVACGLRARGPLRPLGVLAGLAGLAALGAFLAGSFGPFGYGGMERFVVYPVLLWLVAFGGGHLDGVTP